MFLLSFLCLCPIELLSLVCNAVKVPVMASGGAGSIADFVKLWEEVPDVSAGLAASIFHFGEVKICALKQNHKENGITVRI